MILSAYSTMRSDLGRDRDRATAGPRDRALARALTPRIEVVAKLLRGPSCLRAGVNRFARECHSQWGLGHGSVSWCRGRSRERPGRRPNVRWAPGAPRYPRGPGRGEPDRNGPFGPRRRGVCCVTLEMQGKRSTARPCEGRGSVLRARGRATATNQRGNRRPLAAKRKSSSRRRGAKHRQEAAQNAAAVMNNRRPSADLQHNPRRALMIDARACGPREPGVVVLDAGGRRAPAVAGAMHGETHEVSEGPLAADGAHAPGSRSGLKVPANSSRPRIPGPTRTRPRTSSG
jgi:hypothetical protein